MDKHYLIGMGIGAGITAIVLLVVDHTSRPGESEPASQPHIEYIPIPMGSDPPPQNTIDNSAAQRLLWNDESEQETHPHPIYTAPVYPETNYQTQATSGDQSNLGQAPTTTTAPQDDSPAAHATFNPQTGQYYPGIPGGSINSQTGAFYPAVPGGTIDPQTGTYNPQTGE
jgi:hypothetical protein